MLFKKYTLVIFKDLEGGFRKIGVPAYVGLGLIGLMAGLIVLTIYLFGFYSKSIELEHELNNTRRISQEQESQLRTLSREMEEIADAVQRVQKFDSQLRVMLNIDKDEGSETMGDDFEISPYERSSLGKPQVLIQHRELYARHAFSLVTELHDATEFEEVSQQQLLLFLRDNKEAVLSTPSIWPTRGRITSPFGYRSSPTTGRRTLHKGLDIANKIGTPVIAPARGTVTFAGWDKAYGKSIIISHGNNIVTRYAHLNDIKVKQGQTVQRSEVIGALGNTGRSTGPHLHYEVMIGGVPVNPMRYILN